MSAEKRKYEKPEIFDISGPAEQAFGVTQLCGGGQNATGECRNGAHAFANVCSNGAHDPFICSNGNKAEVDCSNGRQAMSSCYNGRYDLGI